ncbi:MAG: TIGR02996 domain-containing protein [Mariniblastus sp.]
MSSNTLMESVTHFNHFFAEVVADPHSDEPRLVYADWLEERGDPRGEFIRVQCELETTNDLQKEFYELSVRSEQLIAQYGEQWAGELEQDFRRSEFRRGFIDKITIRATALLKGAEQLFASTPVNWLRLIYLKGQGKKIAAMPELRQLRSLDLSNLTIPTEDLLAIFSSPNLINLEALTLTNFDWFDRLVAIAITKMESRTNLQKLTINAGRANGFFEDICSGPGFPNLKELTIGSDDFPEENLTHISQLKAPKLGSLTIRSRLSVTDFQTLMGLPLDNLESLDLRNTKVPARGLKMLSEKGVLKQIKHLDLSYCGLGIRSFEILFSEDNLSQCESLDISHSNVATQGTLEKIVERIANHPLPNLKRISLGSFDDVGLAILFQPGSFPQLESLHLESVVIDQSTVEALLEHPIRERLRRLSFSGVDFPGHSAEVLSQGVFPNLVSLRFREAFYGYEDFKTIELNALMQLLSSNAFPEVRELELAGLGGEDGLRRLAAEAILPEVRRFKFTGSHSSVAVVRHFLDSHRLPKLGEFKVGNSFKPSKKLIGEYAPNIVIHF